MHFAQFSIPCSTAFLLSDDNRTTSSASTDFAQKYSWYDLGLYYQSVRVCRWVKLNLEILH